LINRALCATGIAGVEPRIGALPLQAEKQILHRSTLSVLMPWPGHGLL
jgi:hypothetical protein